MKQTCEYTSICKFYDSCAFVCNNATVNREYCGCYRSLSLNPDTSPYNIRRPINESERDHWGKDIEKEDRT